MNAKRFCVIDIGGLSMRLLQGRRDLWIHSLEQGPQALAGTFPLVPASVQASMTTGREPGAHGVVGGALYRRQLHQISFCERSNTLLTRKRFWHSRHLPRRLTAAAVCWSNPLAGAADLVVGACAYGRDDTLASQPPSLAHELIAQWGPPPDLSAGGQACGRGAEWVANLAASIFVDHAPDLQWTYLPGLEAALIRYGTRSPQAGEALAAVDRAARLLASAVQQAGGEAVIVSSGGFVDVCRVALPNVRLREAGLLAVVDTPQGPQVDLERSRAFALADHQFAHLYCQDARAADEASAALMGLPGLAAVLPREMLFCAGLGHDRAGERILLAEPDAWIAYPWWSRSADAPPLAASRDLTGKLGYDPCAWLGGPDGQMDTSPGNVRASRALVNVPLQDQCVLAATCPLPGHHAASITRLPDILKAAIFAQQLTA